MSYNALEVSVENSQPFELYMFKGSYVTYYLTTDAFPHVFDGNTYLPVAGMKRSSLTIGTHEDSSNELSITMPTSQQMVADYAYQTTPPSLVLTIYRVQREDGSFIVYWTGPISSIVTNNNEATFKIPSVFSYALQGSVPSVYVQPPCNNVLFDGKCKVSRANNAVDTVVISVSNRTIVVASVGSFPEGWFIGGELVIASKNDRRTIIKQQGGTLTVNYEFSNLTVGMSVQIAAGCDHSFAGAAGCPKYNNQKNYGGMPFVAGESNNLFVSGVK